MSEIIKKLAILRRLNIRKIDHKIWSNRPF